MPGHIDVARLGARRTELGRQVSLDDPRGPLGAEHRRLLHPHALPSLEPGRDGIQRRAGLDQIAVAPMQDLVDDVLHPGGPAFHLGRDEHVLRPRDIGFGPGRARGVAASRGKRNALVEDPDPPEIHLGETAVDGDQRSEKKGMES